MSPTRNGFRKRQLARPIFLPAVLLVAAESMLLPVLPVSATDFGLDLSGAGALLALILVATLLSELPSARVIALVGERNSLVMSGLAFAAFALLPAFQIGLWVLVVSAAGMGVALALSGLARHSLMTSQVPANQRARALATLGGMFRIGWTTGPLIGSLIISIFSTSAAYLAAAGLATLSVLILASYPQLRLQLERSLNPQGVWRVAQADRQKLLTLGMASGILQAARVVRLVGLPLLAVHLGLEPALAAFIIGAAGLIDVLLFPVGGWLMDRFGRIWGSVPTLLLLGVTYAFTPFVSGAGGFALIAILAALANSISSGVNMVLGSDLAPADSRAEFLASFRLITSVGTTVSPISLSLITAIAGVPMAMAMVASLNFVGVWLFARYLPRFGLSKPRIEG